MSQNTQVNLTKIDTPEDLAPPRPAVGDYYADVSDTRVGELYLVTRFHDGKGVKFTLMSVDTGVAYCSPKKDISHIFGGDDEDFVKVASVETKYALAQ